MRFPFRPFTRSPLGSRAELAGLSFGGAAKSALSLVRQYKDDDMQPKITAMLIMARERRLPLLEALESCGIDVLPVCDCNEARYALETQPQVQVVLTDAALPDGDWRVVFEVVAKGRPNIEVVVCSRLGDHRLWLDVLEQGAYDVLVEPYQCEEIRRILEAAAATSNIVGRQDSSRRSLTGASPSDMNSAYCHQEREVPGARHSD
jgi:two-component system, chemotaxis family, chemotaxis protein CheY